MPTFSALDAWPFSDAPTVAQETSLLSYVMSNADVVADAGIDSGQLDSQNLWVSRNVGTVAQAAHRNPANYFPGTASMNMRGYSRRHPPRLAAGSCAAAAYAFNLLMNLSELSYIFDRVPSIPQRILGDVKCTPHRRS